VSDGLGAIEERLRLLGVAQVAQGHGEVVEVGGDLGVVGAVGGLIDAQSALQEGLTSVRAAEMPASVIRSMFPVTESSERRSTPPRR
jgi:hypothetical protein